MPNLDTTDKKILDLLQRDAKSTNKEIASQLNLSTTPVYERIKRMEREGVISHYVALLDRHKLELSLVAYCTVTLKEHASDFLIQFEKDVMQLEEVTECYHIAGLFDYLLKVVAPDMNTYQAFVADKLAALNNIGRVQSSFVMKEIKHSTRLPL